VQLASHLVAAESCKFLLLFFLLLRLIELIAPGIKKGVFCQRDEETEDDHLSPVHIHIFFYPHPTRYSPTKRERIRHVTHIHMQRGREGGGREGRRERGRKGGKESETEG
jgi:hypothetical protein